MCGIVGYTGREAAAPIVLNGLSKLEYRGYDSAGVAVFNEVENDIDIVKTKGRLKNLLEKTDSGKAMPGGCGIGHTRWATHGAPSEKNAHPHCSDDKMVVMVHNGIIENYQELKDHLTQKGYTFYSETDTEVAVKLIAYYYEKTDHNPLESMSRALLRVRGSFALGIMFKDRPGVIYAARKDSPLIVGQNEGGAFIASDVPAILSYTRNVYYLDNMEMAELHEDSIRFFNMNGDEIEKEMVNIKWDAEAAEKGGFEHFMMKEIHEQPKALKDTINTYVKDGKIDLSSVGISPEEFAQYHRICIVACGSAYHVGVVAKYAIEKTVRIPVEIDIASEFRYRDPIIDENVLVLVISQSGETADTLAALREAKKLGARVLSIVNVVGSSIANESDDVLYTWAGPEISVATTKAYSTQLCVVYLLVLYMADLLGTISKQEYQNYVADLEALPSLIEKTISDTKQIQAVAAKYYQCENIFFIGRNIDYALSLEGSLKLKEISYIHSEAYAAGELKHGSISLIEDGTLVVSLATYEALFDKMMSNIKEVKARGATVLSLTTEDKTIIESETDEVFYIPNINSMMAPSLAVLPLQLFAYYVADNRGCDIDKPRNLAKSVTVE